MDIINGLNAAYYATQQLAYNSDYYVQMMFDKEEGELIPIYHRRGEFTHLDWDKYEWIRNYTEPATMEEIKQDTLAYFMG